MKISVFWDTMPYVYIKVPRQGVRGASCLHLQDSPIVLAMYTNIHGIIPRQMDIFISNTHRTPNLAKMVNSVP
jgi:hypothetical protein